MRNFEIKKRKLSADEIDLLKREIKDDPFVSGYSRKEWSRINHVFVAENSGKLAGICVCDEIVDGWVEIGLLYVLENERKNGVGENLVKVAVADTHARGKNMFIVSRNPDLSKKFKSYGFETCKFHQLPLPIILHNIVFSLSFYRMSEYLRKLFSGQAKGLPVFGIKKLGE